MSQEMTYDEFKQGMNEFRTEMRHEFSLVRNELDIKTEQLRTEIHRETAATFRLMLGAIISIWIVTLITASTLYMLTR